MGQKWNKVDDVLQFDMPVVPAVLTKRGILAYLARVYDPLGLISPVLLKGNIVYRKICEAKVRWDGSLPDELSKRWSRWESSLPNRVPFPRSIPANSEPIKEMQINSFGDASKKGAAVYAIVKQQSGVVQGLTAAKSRLAKRT